MIVGGVFLASKSNGTIPPSIVFTSPGSATANNNNSRVPSPTQAQRGLKSLVRW